MRLIFSSILFSLVLLSGLCSAADSVIRPENVAVVINTENPNSKEIGQYYLKARGIPLKNLIEVTVPGSPSRISKEQFNLLKEKIYSNLGEDIQVIVLAWTTPYAVECNSITSALTLGFDEKQCEKTCGPGTPSAYFNSAVSKPTDLGLRLSMLLPTDSTENAKALIDRGILSGFRVNEASAYFLTTKDKARSSRARFFPRPGGIPEKKLHVYRLNREYIEKMHDVMIYHTGQSFVEKLETLTFLPGALADHLTSSGGYLINNKWQMSSLKWLDAGATASYGTVSEPCNYWQKFPNSAVLLKNYLEGETAIEAYWKSVAWPAQGVFIGEPLAAPYCKTCALDVWRDPNQ